MVESNYIVTYFDLKTCNELNIPTQVGSKQKWLHKENIIGLM